MEPEELLRPGGPRLGHRHVALRRRREGVDVEVQGGDVGRDGPQFPVVVHQQALARRAQDVEDLPVQGHEPPAEVRRAERLDGQVLPELDEAGGGPDGLAELAQGEVRQKFEKLHQLGRFVGQVKGEPLRSREVHLDLEEGRAPQGRPAERAQRDAAVPELGFGLQEKLRGRLVARVFEGPPQDAIIGRRLDEIFLLPLSDEALFELAAVRDPARRATGPAAGVLPPFDDLQVRPFDPDEVHVGDLPQAPGEERRPVRRPVLDEPVVNRIHRPVHRLAGEGALEAAADAGRVHSLSAAQRGLPKRSNFRRGM